jgi:hypothetical protein
MAADPSLGDCSGIARWMRKTKRECEEWRTVKRRSFGVKIVPSGTDA